MALAVDLQILSPSARADRLGDEIARLSAQMTVAERELLHAIADFDLAGAYVEHGALTTSQWLGYRVGLSSAAASEKVRVGRALKALPAIDAAFARAEVSYSKVRALTRVATPQTEEELLELARTATAHQLEQICRKYRAARCEETELEAALERFVQVRSTERGATRVTIQLPPDEAARLLAAMDAARAELSPPRGSSAEDRPTRVDGALAMAESYFATGARPRRGGAPHEVVVHVDASRLAETAGSDERADERPDERPDEAVGHVENGAGQGVGRATARRVCCDASVSALVTDEDGAVLSAGRRRRTVPAPMRRALDARAGHRCQFPGCTHRHYLDAHHVRHWADGGETKLSNLILLCRRHHVFVHEHGWRVELGADGTPAFRSPRDRVLEATPPAPSAEDLTPLGDLVGRTAPDALSPIGQWGPADYGYIIDLLMQGANRPRA